MPKFTEFYSNSDVKDIMERFLERFPGMFEGFDVDSINVIFTKGKKSDHPVKLRSVGYPMDVYIGKPYILEVFDLWWRDMTPMQKNMSVFHIMCAIPGEGFDEQAKDYAKKRKPDISMYMLEYAACGGVPNWYENPMARDPMEMTIDEIEIANGADPEEAIPDNIRRIPVTVGDIASVGLKSASA